MGKIKVLTQDLVNKIAAGEVVEKPASIVKELLDNSLDAGANQITIDIEEGGIKKIHIVDNGSGMDPEDAQLAFQAHATSKLSTEDDLLNIKSFGFRGEALASIAAVSKVTLKTKTTQDSLATEIKIEGGRVISVSQTGGATGTSILVEDLFYNVPARKQFLRAAPSEYKDILEVVNSHAMAKPNAGITIINNGRTVYSFPKNHQLEDRVREIVGNDYYEKLVPIFFEHPHLEIYGFVGKPEIAGERKKHQYIFVNKRHIENKSVSFAAKDAYGSLIPKNTYPVFIIFIDVAPNIVDVNVHPRKEEVKFTNDHLIFDSVKSAVKKALERVNLTPGSIPQASGMSFDSSHIKPPLGNIPVGSIPQTPGFIRPFPQVMNTPKNSPVFPNTSPNAPSIFDRPNINPITRQTDSLDDPFGKLPWEEEIDITPTIPTPTNPIKILSVHHLYFVVESESGIEIYDQHAVHERIMYEKLTNQHKKNSEQSSSQTLFAPIIVNLSVEESEVIKELMPKFEEIGFAMEEFGPNSYKITQIPILLDKVDIKTLIHELIEDLQSPNNELKIDTQSNKILTYLSCRLAYKAGDSIPLEEISELITHISKLDNQYTCPHGRPFRVEITLKELSKMFKRT